MLLLDTLEVMKEGLGPVYREAKFSVEFLNCKNSQLCTHVHIYKQVQFLVIIAVFRRYRLSNVIAEWEITWIEA